MKKTYLLQMLIPQIDLIKFRAETDDKDIIQNLSAFFQISK